MDILDFAQSFSDDPKGRLKLSSKKSADTIGKDRGSGHVLVLPTIHVPKQSTPDFQTTLDSDFKCNTSVSVV